LGKQRGARSAASGPPRAGGCLVERRGQEGAMPVKPGWEGRYFEDFAVGDVYQCRLGRTVTEADNIWFTLLTNNTNQIHFNNEYGKRTEFGRCLINSALTLAIVAGMGVADVSENGFALGWDYIKLPHPLFAGDTLYSESEVREVRESKSRPQQGIVKVRTRGLNQDGQVVIEYERSVMVWRKAHAPQINLFPERRE
jgi:acyl dehydratase